MGDRCRVQGRVVLGKMCEVDRGQIRQKTTNGLGWGGQGKKAGGVKGKKPKKNNNKKKMGKEYKRRWEIN